MKEQACIRFLQWALPQLHMRWKGFKKVRGQVCKRIRNRLIQLNLSDFNDYKDFLKKHPDEWQILDSLSRITISRFNRDKQVFEYVMNRAVTMLKIQPHLKICSIGCASGEEPYTLSLFLLNSSVIDLSRTHVEILAIDSERHLLERARKGCYQYGTLKDLPEELIERCFSKNGEVFCLYDKYKAPVIFNLQDIRYKMPEGTFDLMLCRNLVATYYTDSLQRRIFEDIAAHIKEGGYLVLGKEEKFDTLPDTLKIWKQQERIFQKFSGR